MTNKIHVTEGVVAFVNLDKTDFYNGQDTGKYNITVSLGDDQAQTLDDLGVKVGRREYKNVEYVQRKFSTKFPGTPVLDADGNPTSNLIPYGSTVRVQWEEGDTHPVHGLGTYLKKVKVLELAEGGAGDDEDF